MQKTNIYKAYLRLNISKNKKYAYKLWKLKNKQHQLQTFCLELKFTENFHVFFNLEILREHI